MKRRLYVNGCQFKSKKELGESLLQVSQIITKNEILKLNNFMDERIVQVTSRKVN